VIKYAFVVAGESDTGQMGREAALAKPRYPKIEVSVKHALSSSSFSSLVFPTAVLYGLVTRTAITRVERRRQSREPVLGERE
jgi:hypothetical protein